MVASWAFGGPDSGTGATSISAEKPEQQACSTGPEAIFPSDDPEEVPVWARDGDDLPWLRLWDRSPAGIHALKADARQLLAACPGARDLAKAAGRLEISLMANVAAAERARHGWTREIVITFASLDGLDTLATLVMGVGRQPGIVPHYGRDAPPCGGAAFIPVPALRLPPSSSF